jgi:hypothetical protein
MWCGWQSWFRSFHYAAGLLQSSGGIVVGGGAIFNVKDLFRD